MNNAYEALLKLIKKKSKISDPMGFQSIVNVVFHDYEAKYYDKIHSEMWDSLPQQFSLIFNDIKNTVKIGENLKLLDIGCGTGLATQFLLDTPMGDRITNIHLLDTSLEMLAKAKKRAKKWKKDYKLIQGDISKVKDDYYDVIIVSSVLHHIPDLTDFLHSILNIQKPGGLLITIHDPSMESIKSDVYKQRCEEYNAHEKKVIKNNSIFSRIRNKIRHTINPVNYIEQVNNKLLNDNIIKEPLTQVELWSITDIHVEGLPYSANNGISKQLMIDNLLQYSVISYRTYGFYGSLCSTLVAPYREYEKQLTLQDDLNGRNFSSVWVRNS